MNFCRTEFYKNIIKRRKREFHQILTELPSSFFTASRSFSYFAKYLEQCKNALFISSLLLKHVCKHHDQISAEVLKLPCHCTREQCCTFPSQSEWNQSSLSQSQILRSESLPNPHQLHKLQEKVVKVFLFFLLSSTLLPLLQEQLLDPVSCAKKRMQKKLT